MQPEFTDRLVDPRMGLSGLLRGCTCNKATALISLQLAWSASLTPAQLGHSGNSEAKLLFISEIVAALDDKYR